jgi:hypothetical protein
MEDTSADVLAGGGIDLLPFREELGTHLVVFGIIIVSLVETFSNCP